MSKNAGRERIKTKFEGVFYRLSAKRDPRTGELDRIYSFWYADVDGKGHWKTCGRHSEGMRPPLARAERAKFLAQIEGGVNPAHMDKITVGAAVDAYVSWAKAEGKHITEPYDQYAKHMRHRLHNVPITSVSPGMLTAIKAELIKTQVANGGKTQDSTTHHPPKFLSTQTIFHLFSFLRAAVYRAIGTGLWNGVNPFSSRRGGMWQMPKVDNARLRFFSPQEAKDLLAELTSRSKELHDMAYVSLKTGLRITEIFKLRGQDVDARAGVLHTLSKGGSFDQVGAPSDVIAMLQEYDAGSGFIFPKRGKPEQRDQVSPAFARAVKKVGMNTPGTDSRYWVTFHTFRHTFASWLAQSGKVTLLELQNLMRHEDISMTQRYAHLIPGHEHQKLSIIEEILDKSDAPTPPLPSSHDRRRYTRPARRVRKK